MITVRVKKLHKHAQNPTHAHSDDAGADLYSVENVVIYRGQSKTVRTGIALEIPPRYVGLIWDKSGLAFKRDITTLGGVVDSTFRGEILVRLRNHGDRDFYIGIGDKIAQLLVQEIPEVKFVEEEHLTPSRRGEDGFGSSGR